jgi:hypothetical protein
MNTQATSSDIPSTTNDQSPARTDHPAHEGARMEGSGWEDRTLSHGTPSAPLFGRLPVARWIPMDVHSMMDYGNVLATGSGALTTECTEARIASVALAGAGLVVSSLTDYRLSVAKVIPIEAHETIDYVWGVAAIAAPFVFGYWKKAPGVALSHVIAGAGNILASLVTDYRAYCGRGQPLRERIAGAR